MMRLYNVVFLLMTSFPLAFADVEFTSPAAGTTIAAGSTFEVSWKDSGNAPSISDLKTYTLLLFSGSNASPTQLYKLSSGTLGSTASISVTVPPAIGGDTENAYFVGMLSVASAGGTVESFSDRFTLSGMTGTFTDAVKNDLESVSGTSGPPTDNKVAAKAAVADDGGDRQFEVPYTLQTGLTRYAPMQPVPPSKITATNTAPLYPTSAYDLATTILPTPSVQTTITQSQTWSTASHANTAAAQPGPAGDMQRFLNRWKD